MTVKILRFILSYTLLVKVGSSQDRERGGAGEISFYV